LPIRCIASYLFAVPPDRHTEFGFLVARFSRRLRQAMDAEMRLIGLTEATWRPLVYVRSLGDGVRQKELASAMSIEGPSLVRLLDNLERRGFIERREDENDRRARGIHLTRAGLDLAVRAARVGNGLQKRLLGSVPAADLDICERVLESLERELEEPQQAADEPKRRKR
jgi:MarR family transcriptional regulator for hemolysin